jgi:hypothetical protein
MTAQVYLKRMPSIIMNQNLHDKRPHRRWQDGRPDTRGTICLLANS